MKVKIYGCRASVAVSRPSRYGSNTACMRVDIDGQTLIIDAGSGLLRLEDELRVNPGFPKKLPFQIDILLSHLHLDHIIGLTTFAPVLDEDAGVRIFVANHDERPLKEQIFQAFEPPYWPAPLDVIAQAECIPIKGAFSIGAFDITPFESNHPNGTLSFRITDGNKVLVYMLDSEVSTLDKLHYEIMVSHCMNADLVVFDSTYAVEDYPARKGWGHSTPADAVKLADLSRCKKMLLSHFCHTYSDAKIDTFHSQGKRFLAAYEGMEIEL